MKTAYLIGIKGVGMTALAKYLSEDSYEVEGSDNLDSYITDEILVKNNIKVLAPFGKENLKNKKPDLVVVSAAYNDSNVEVEEALRLKLNLIYYSDELARITSDKKLIAVAGIHGKTTTSSLISLLLKKAELDPSYLIGAANIPVLGSNAHRGEGDYFVLEADEYRKSPDSKVSKFLCLNPEIAVISSIELDHPDLFDSIEDIYNAFYGFACRVPRNGKILLNIDYQKARKLQRSLVDRNFETYGFSPDASWQVVDVCEDEKTIFSLKHNKDIFGPYELNVPGKHNILNAATAVIIADLLDIDQKVLKQTLFDFICPQRRFEKVDQIDEIIIFDDYAHHPTAITKTLEAAKAKFPNSRLWCIFQPHTYSRTKSLLADFGSAFKAADKIIVTDIYSSAREKTGDVTAMDLVHEIQKNKGNVQYMNDPEKIKRYLSNFVKSPSVVMTLGAGDIYKLGREIPALFKK